MLSTSLKFQSPMEKTIQQYVPTTTTKVTSLLANYTMNTTNSSTSSLMEEVSISIPNVSTTANKKIPRPPNSFMTYRKEKQQEIMEKFKGINNKDVSRIIGQMWRHEPHVVKDYYRKKAEVLKREHALKYPGYKYRPKKKKGQTDNAILQAAIESQLPQLTQQKLSLGNLFYNPKSLTTEQEISHAISLPGLGISHSLSFHDLRTMGVPTIQRLSASEENLPDYLESNSLNGSDNEGSRGLENNGLDIVEGVFRRPSQLQQLQQQQQRQESSHLSMDVFIHPPSTKHCNYEESWKFLMPPTKAKLDRSHNSSNSDLSTGDGSYSSLDSFLNSNDPSDNVPLFQQDGFFGNVLPTTSVLVSDDNINTLATYDFLSSHLAFNDEAISQAPGTSFNSNLLIPNYGVSSSFQNDVQVVAERDMLKPRSIRHHNSDTPLFVKNKRSREGSIKLSSEVESNLITTSQTYVFK